MAEVHPFDLTNINNTQINDAALAKRIMVDVGTVGVGVSASLYATPEQILQMGADIGSTNNAILRSKPNGTKKAAYSVVTLDDVGNMGGINAARFSTSPTSVPTTVGTMSWDDGNGSLSLTLKGGNVNQVIGQDEIHLCHNSSASVALSKGNVVKIVGAQGNRISVAKAQANSEANSVHTIGFVAESISTLSEGFVISSGLIKNLDTRYDSHGSSFSAGDTVYLSPTIAGGFTKTKPSAPDQTVIIGFVVRVHQSVGSIFIKVDNGYEIDELHNVSSTGSGSAFLIRNDSTNLWEDKTPASARDVINGAATANSVTTANYTPALTDVQDYILMNYTGGPQSVTIPTNGSVPFPVGTTLNIIQKSEQQVTIETSVGVILRVRGYGNAIAGQWGVAVLIKIDTNEWVLTGDITYIPIS